MRLPQFSARGPCWLAFSSFLPEDPAGLPSPVFCPRTLLTCLALFRPRKQALPWRRSLRLAEEVVAFVAECGGGDEKILANALNIMVDAMRQTGELPLR